MEIKTVWVGYIEISEFDFQILELEGFLIGWIEFHPFLKVTQFSTEGVNASGYYCLSYMSVSWDLKI